MSAALSLVSEPVTDENDPRVLLRIAALMTEQRLARLAVLESEIVDDLDERDALLDEINRGQAMQIDLLRSIARGSR